MEEESGSDGSEIDIQEILAAQGVENPSPDQDSDAMESDASSEDASSSETETGLPRVTFNQNLPAQHQYLGTDMEDVGGGHVLREEKSVVEGLPLLALPGVVLTPGQTLPLHSLHPRHVSMFRSIISNHKVFGVINMRIDGENGYELAKVGTVAQVMAFKELTEQEVTTLTMRAIGRQRFKLINSIRSIDGTLIAKVLILPEIVLPNPLSCTGLAHKAKFRRGRRKMSEGLHRPASAGKWIYPALTGIPAFILKQFDEDAVVGEIVRELSQWYEPKKVAGLAEDRVGLSHWVAANLPLSDDNKLLLLTIDSSLQRLRMELTLMRRYSELCCSRCGIVVGDKDSIFSMSVDGPMGAYVNPGGYIHEMITLLKTRNIESITRPTTENSWFPGYAWEILQCKRCQSHMGWRFSTRDKELKPSHFWGITRSSITPRMKSEEEEERKLPFPFGLRLSTALAALTQRRSDSQS